MTQGGHNAKSIADHRREGTYRANRHDDRLDERHWHTGGSPEMPEGLTPRQKWCWSEIVGGIRAENIAALDSLALLLLVNAFEDYAEATAIARDSTSEADECGPATPLRPTQR